MEKVKAKLLKLLALKNQGVGGEAANAAAALDRALQKHGLTMADLEDGHDVRRYAFTPRNGFEKKLLIQIMAHVIPDWEGHCWKYNNSQKREFDLTPAQYAEASVMFDIYRKDLRKTLQHAYSAFIHANKIFPTRESEPDPDEKPMDMEEMEAIGSMMQGIQPSRIRKQLEG